MIDNLFAPFITFATLIAGTITLVLSLIGTVPNSTVATVPRQTTSLQPVVELERVMVIGKRVLPRSKVLNATSLLRP